MLCNADECRRFAEESERVAGRASDPQKRAVMLAVARMWRELAEECEGSRNAA